MGQRAASRAGGDRVLTSAAARRLERIGRRLEDLRAWRNAREQAIPQWWFAAEGAGPVPLPIGAVWPGVAGELDLWLGGAGLIRLSTGYVGAIDPFHHRYSLTDAAAGGEPVTIAAEVVPKGMFGVNVPEPRLERAHLVVPERGVRALAR